MKATAMTNFHPITIVRPSRSLTGLACAVAVACTVFGLLTPSSEGASQSTRLLHQQESAQRAAVWSRLFPEGPALDSSLLYLDPVLDDITPYAHHVQVVDAGNGAVQSMGGLHLTAESEAIDMMLAQWLPEEPDSSFAAASFVSGVIIGASGDQRAIFGVRLAITINEISLIAPVNADVLIPLAFPEASRHADAIVRSASAALFGSELPSEEDGELSAGKKGPGPGGEGPTPTTPPCVAQAWSSLVASMAALWVDSGVAQSDCFLECILDPDSGVDGQTRVRSCLPACGLGFLAGGEGSITWAWSELGAATRDCANESGDGVDLGSYSLR